MSENSMEKTKVMKLKMIPKTMKDEMISNRRKILCPKRLFQCFRSLTKALRKNESDKTDAKKVWNETKRL